MTGEKRFLGFVETDTENEKVLTPFLRLLVERGLDVSQGLLVIVDGGKGAPGGRPQGVPPPRVGPTVSVAQARERGELPGQERASVVAPTPPTGRTTVPHTTKPSQPSTRSIGELEDRNQSAARSLAEGLEETLTLHRLGLYGVLGRSLKTTNGLESVNALVEETLCEGRPLAELEVNVTAGWRPHSWISNHACGR